MSRNSTVIDQSAKWAPAEEILDAGSQQATAVGLDSSSPSNEAGASDQTAPTNTANGSALGSDPNVPPTPVVPTLPFVPPPPPPPLPSSISNSNVLPTTRSANSSIPLIPVRRTSQGPAPVPGQPRPSSGASPAPQSNRVASATTPRSSLYPPRQGSYGSTAPTPYIGGPMTPTSYPNQPYQLSSSSAPPMFASPAPMSSYGSPAPIPYQSPASYPPGGPMPPPSQRPSTSPAQTPYSSYGTSVASPGQPIPLRSQRPATTGAPSAPQTPASQSMYGTSPAYASVPQQAPILSTSQNRGSQSMYGTSPAYGGSAPQPTSARPQSYGGPIIPGAPLLPYSNLPQQPVVVGGPKTPGRRRTDAFVANDPFRPHSHSKHDKPSDELTFDDIPVPGATVVSQPWSKYDPSPSEIPTSQYPNTNSQPTWGSVSAPPASYPPISSGQQNQSQPPSSVSWRPNSSSPYYAPSQSNTNPPLTYASGSSQYPPSSQPIYNRPSSATTSPMPYDGSSQYRPYPQVPLEQMPYPSGDTTGRTSSPGPTSQLPMQRPSAVETTPYPTGPPPASSSDISLNHQPTQATLEPVTEAPPRQDDHERPQTPISRPPTPGDRPPDVYPPPRFGYPTPVVYDPNDPSTFPPPSPPIPIYPFDPYYPPPSPPVGMYPMPTPKQSIWSRVGNVFRWPFSRRRHDDYLQPDLPYIPPIWSPPPSSEESKSGYPSLVVRFIVKTMPREVYLHFLLRLPSLYFSRVARIFEEADLTLPEIKKMALQTASQGKNAQFDHLQVFESNNVPPEYERLKSTWEAFIDSVMREWKTFNIISVLLLSAILTILQIQSAADDPLTRNFAIFSLLCALISLLFGCMYIIRFGSMRKTYKAAEWALEAKKSKTVIWWNVWVLLAMPVVWLTWSIMLYIACIMSFVWRTSAQGANPPGDLSKGGLLIVRIVITVVLGLGMLYGWLILSTFSKYGEVMDKAWKQRIDGWLEEKAATQFLPQSIAPYTPYYDPSSQTQPQSSQYPGYSETVPDYRSRAPDYPSSIPDYRSSAPAYTSQPSYGSYPPDSKVGYTGPDFGPTYANAGYVPPPEPYDSPAQSRSGSPQSTSSTLYATRVNTQYNKTSGLQREDSMSSAIYNGPVYATQHPLPPPPPKEGAYSNMPPPRLVPQKTPLAVPPGPNLPPIPGTPMTVFSNRSSVNASLREGEAHDDDGNNSAGLTTGRNPRDDADDETHVRFRSPLISAQGSFSFAGSDKEVEEPLLSAAEASGSSFTARVSPISSEHGDLGRESESLRRRRLG